MATKDTLRYRWLFNASILSGLFVAIFATPTIAAITRSYTTDDPSLRPGLVVSLSPTSTSEDPKVERASLDNADRVIGVATTVEDSLVTIASPEQTTYIQLDGEVGAFVVNLDGDIKQGDFLALSPLKGILTRATPTSPIIAIAAEDFNEEKAELYPIQEGSKTKDVFIQQIRVNLDRKTIASLSSSKEESALAKLGRAIIGRDVGEIRVVIALIIFFIVLVAEGTIIYGAISSAISSMGRNPLAGNIIRHELVRVLFIALGVLGVGLAAVYAVLWI